MHEKLLLLVLALVFSIPDSRAQISIFGKILSLPAKKPIAFTNIGILNGSVGTISELDGRFTMEISRKYLYDTLIFSALGYEKVQIPIHKLLDKNEINIYLKEISYKLSEVVVTADRGKIKSIYAGNAEFEGSSIYADTVNAGSAMAILIRNKNRKGKVRFDYPTYIRDAQVMILNNTFERFKVRVRLYDVVNKGGKPMPGKDLLNESIVEESGIRDGWLTFDLTSYRVKVKDDFFLAFEWILEKEDRTNLFNQFATFRRENPEKVAVNYSWVNGEKVVFDNYQGNFYFGTSFGMSVASSILRDNLCYYRLNSFGQWYASPSILAARVRTSHWIESDAQTVEEEIDTSRQDEIRSYYHLGTYAEIEPLDIQEDIPNAEPFFYSRKSEPLDIYVSRNENKLSFYAWNRGIYPYRLSLAFSNILNLSPLVSEKKYLVYPGRMQLLSLEVVDDDVENYHYELAVKEEIGDSTLIPKGDFPYLIPVETVLKMEQNNSAFVDPMTSRFLLQEGDTIYAMRKGVITAGPGSGRDIDRIGALTSLEILHPDGTVMVYSGIDTVQSFREVGEWILPGEALCIVNSTKALDVNLFQILPGEKLNRLKINYATKAGFLNSYSELEEGRRPDYPEEIIRLEMSEKK